MPGKTAAQIKRQKEKDRKKKQRETEAIKQEHERGHDKAAERESELKVVLALLEKIQRKMIDVPADGNCLFHALVQQHGEVQLTKLSAEALRATVGEYLLSHREKFAPFWTPEAGDSDDEEETWESRCARVKSDSSLWGSTLEVAAAADLFRVRIGLLGEAGVQIFGPDSPDGNTNSFDWCIVHLKHMYVLGEHFNGTVSLTPSGAASSK